jgi:hypothetical protein
MEMTKGTTVKVQTTNGGELTAPLYSNYRQTYEIVLTLPYGEVVIPPWRVKSVEAA